MDDVVSTWEKSCLVEHDVQEDIVEASDVSILRKDTEII